ncbi:MAG: phosphoribosyltransferase [Candidatus Pacearchaeota archaeon]|jgi:hypoxanthine-guanine phosphoribosyltransferase
MANPGRNKEAYQKAVETFDLLGSGHYAERAAHDSLKVYNLFLTGYNPGEVRAETNLGFRLLKTLKRYASLTAKRNRVVIADGEREIATEEDAFDGLVCTHVLASELVAPFFVGKNTLSDRIFKDIASLGFSYVEAVTNCVAEQYIGEESSLEEKCLAVDLARQALRVGELYRSEGLGRKTQSEIRRLTPFIVGITGKAKAIRSFENVSTTRKKVYKKRELMSKLCAELTETEDGKLTYVPDFIFPIANGAIEFGIWLANAYEDVGIYEEDKEPPTVYPVMFSIKTRKQREPWVEHDTSVLGKGLERTSVLVLEDWVTTGNTLRGILMEVEKHFPREIRVATLKRDPRSFEVPLLENYRFYTGQVSEYTGSKTDSLTDVE